jgi:hypothetical protein
MPGQNKPYDECGEVFWRENLMSQHLTAEHRLDAATASSRLEAYHVGPNHQHGFWCGFCRRVVQLQAPLGVEAYDERFTHIDHHLVKERRSIETWVDVRACATKLEMRVRREREARAASAEAEEAAAGALVHAAQQAAAAANVRERARERAKRARTEAAEAPVRPTAMAGYREAEERSGMVQQEEYGHTRWFCVSGSLGRSRGC